MKASRKRIKRGELYFGKKPALVTFTAFLATTGIIIVFKPGDIRNAEELEVLLLAGYFGSIPILISATVYYVLFQGEKKMKEWKLSTELILILTIGISGSALTYLYCVILVLMFPDKYTLFSNTLFDSIYYPLFITLGVYSCLKLKDQIELLTSERDKLLKQTSHSETRKDRIVTLESNTKNTHVIKLQLDDIIYFESNANYIKVCYQENGEVKSFMIRKTLKEVEKENSKYSDQLFRCHKSFIINTHRLKGVKGNSRVTTAIMDFDIYIPVSTAKRRELVSKSKSG